MGKSDQDTGLEMRLILTTLVLRFQETKGRVYVRMVTQNI